MTHPIFLDIDPTIAADPSSPYAVLPLPYERTVTYGPGTRSAPAAILEASHETEDFDEELRLPTDLRVQTLDAPDFEGKDDAEALDCIRSAAESVLQKQWLLSLGGEHTVALPLVSAALTAYENVSVLQIDAHADLRQSYGGTELSHACVMRRIRELGVPTIQVGIRSISATEHEYVQEQGLSLVWASDICRATDTIWADEIANHLTDPVYITIDIDALDPSLAPGTGTPEPGGLDWSQITALLRNVFAKRQVIGADICETAPIPGTHVTEFTAARLGQKLLVYHRHKDALRPSCS